MGRQIPILSESAPSRALASHGLGGALGALIIQSAKVGLPVLPFQPPSALSLDSTNTGLARQPPTTAVATRPQTRVPCPVARRNSEARGCGERSLRHNIQRLQGAFASVPRAVGEKPGRWLLSTAQYVLDPRLISAGKEPRGREIWEAPGTGRPLRAPLGTVPFL